MHHIKDRSCKNRTGALALTASGLASRGPACSRNFRRGWNKSGLQGERELLNIYTLLLAREVLSEGWRNIWEGNLTCSPSSDCCPWSICLGLLPQAGRAGKELRGDARGTHRASHPRAAGVGTGMGGEDFRCLGGLTTSSSLGLSIGKLGVAIKLPVNSCPSLTGSRLGSRQAPFQVETMKNWAEGLGDAGPPCPGRGAQRRLIPRGAVAETKAAHAFL